MKRKPGLERLMKTKAELSELGGQVLLGDYPEGGDARNSWEAGPGTGENLELLALTFCRPGLYWAFARMKDVFRDYADSLAIIDRLIGAAGKATGRRGITDKALMISVISEAEKIVEEKMTGRIGRIMKSAASLSKKK